MAYGLGEPLYKLYKVDKTIWHFSSYTVINPYFRQAAKNFHTLTAHREWKLIGIISSAILSGYWLPWCKHSLRKIQVSDFQMFDNIKSMIQYTGALIKLRISFFTNIKIDLQVINFDQLCLWSLSNWGSNCNCFLEAVDGVHSLWTWCWKMLILTGPLPLGGRGALDQGMVNFG